MIRAANDFRGTYNLTDYRWFNLRDANTSDPPVAQHFGLLRDDYTEKPAFATVRKVYAEIARRYPAGTQGQRNSNGCLRHAGTLRRTGIGQARLGSRQADLIRRLGPPVTRSAAQLRYCVDGGGKLLLAFDKRGRLRLAASTSFSTRVHRLRTGTSLRRVKRVYPHARWIGRRLLRASRHSRVVFGACSCGSVSFVAVTKAGSNARVRYWVRRVGLRRAKAASQAATAASTRPKFPRSVAGTISGAASSSRGGTTNKESWTIKGVRFELEHVRFVENTWTGF